MPGQCLADSEALSGLPSWLRFSGSWQGGQRAAVSKEGVQWGVQAQGAHAHN